MRRPIKTINEYDEIFTDVESLMRAEFDTLAGDYLDALVALIELYEREQSFIEAGMLHK